MDSGSVFDYNEKRVDDRRWREVEEEGGGGGGVGVGETEKEK